jgi:simple sugar transport system ATP-binding protein
MVGSVTPAIQRAPAAVDPAPRLEAIGLSAPADDPFGTALHDIAFTLRGGEVLGIAGISGNGQRELLALLSGERGCAADMLWLDGTTIGDLPVASRRARGLAFVPEERLGRGAASDLSLADNTLLTGHADGLVRRGLIDRKAVAARARAVIDRFGVKCRGPEAAARSLSGGNLQKFIVGREIALAPRVLIVAQPSWGVDVAAAAFIRQTLVDLSRSGAAILVISEELDEVFEICDRIAVMYRGRLSPPVPSAETDAERVGLLMAGIGPGFQEAA